MLNGLDILIARMKDHPEEFIKNGKWTTLLVAVDKHLTEEEKQSLKQGFSDMARDAFNEVVLKSIANEPIEHDLVDAIECDYDSVMAYPMEQAKQRKLMHEQEEARQIEMMKMEMARQQAAQQQYNPYNDSLTRGILNTNTSGRW